jgi:hypothetical protein
MSGFVSLPPASDADPPATTPPDIVAGDGWFPDIDLVALRDSYRLDTTIPPARLRDAVRDAMIDIADELAEWRAAREAEGHDSLAAISSPEFGGRPRLLVIYDRAIGSLVSAELADRLLDATATAAGHDRAAELEEPGCKHRRRYRWAISDILGKPRATVELI